MLRGVDYADSDRVVTLLTRRFGKASFIARGARRSKKRFGGALQPLQLLSVEISQSAARLGSLARAEVVRTFPRVLGDLPRMAAAFTATELVRELLPEHEPDAGVFGTVLDMFAALDAGELVPERLSLCFQVRLLSLCGFAPQLDCCGLCGKRPAAGQTASFDAHLGHLVCRGCGGGSERIAGSVRALLMRAGGADWVLAARAPCLDGELAGARAALRAFIEHRIGRPLRSTALSAVASQEPDT